MPKYWIAVASREHVLIGKKEGIAQVCHGKQNPLQKMKPGDWIIYYSPVILFGQKEPCRKFTAVGQVKDKEPYQVTMEHNFAPWRRDINYLKTQEASIEPLIQELSFIKNKKNWGFVFRYGIIAIPCDDFKLIASKMGITLEHIE
jgi:predicted RNA-binding protein